MYRLYTFYGIPRHCERCMYTYEVSATCDGGGFCLRAHCYDKDDDVVTVVVLVFLPIVVTGVPFDSSMYTLPAVSEPIFASIRTETENGCA